MAKTVLNFFKVSPSGNITILIEESEPDFFSSKERVSLAKILMNPLHLGAEQVGFFYFDESANLPKLEMMGGEFCGNACRALAFVLGLQKNKILSGKLLCSGAEQPVDYELSRTLEPDKLKKISKTSSDEADGTKGLDLSVADGQISSKIFVNLGYFGFDFFIESRKKLPEIAELENSSVEDVIIVRLGGITHVLLPLSKDALILPLNHQAEQTKIVTEKIRQIFNLENEEAVGCIWYEFLPFVQTGNSDNAFCRLKMYPFVWVKKTNSLCFESACGSGALALALAVLDEKIIYIDETGITAQTDIFTLDILQPSGACIRIEISKKNFFEGKEKSLVTKLPLRASIGGPVFLIAVGRTYLDFNLQDV